MLGALKRFIPKTLPKPQVDAGEERTNSMHLPSHLPPLPFAITGKHSGCVTLPAELPQHEIELPLCPEKIQSCLLLGKIENEIDEFLFFMFLVSSRTERLFW
jgi:hypothetical protein